MKIKYGEHYNYTAFYPVIVSRLQHRENPKQRFLVCLIWEDETGHLKRKSQLEFMGFIASDSPP